MLLYNITRLTKADNLRPQLVLEMQPSKIIHLPVLPVDVMKPGGLIKQLCRE